MGRSRQPRPKHLAKKLRALRLALGLTQNEMFELLKDKNTPIYVGHISLYESGQRIPPLTILLGYARAAKTTMETLVDDKIRYP